MKRLLLITLGLSLSLGVFQAHCEEPPPDEVTDVDPDMMSNGWHVRAPTGTLPQPLFEHTPSVGYSDPIPTGGLPALSTNGLPQLLAPSTQDAALIVETARALDNNFDNIYRFVRDNIRFTPTWGFQRGAVRTLLDREGNDADQALLLVTLLRAAGYPATVDYCILDVIDANDPDGYDALHWLGVSDVDTAVQEMQQAGYLYPYWYSGSGIFEVDRFVVVADAYGYRYTLDPAFKPRTITPPRAAQSDMGYSRDSLLTSALSGATTDTNNYVRLLNDANIRSTMNTLAGNLATAWHNAASNTDASAFAGGDVIVPQTPWDYYYLHGGDAYDFFPDLLATNAATLNGLFRTGVTFVHGALTNAFWLDEMASRTVWLDYTNATGYVYPKAVLHVDDTILATESKGSSVSNVSASIAVTNSFLTYLRQPYSLIRSNANVFVIPSGVSSSYGGMRDRDTRTLERLGATNPTGGHRVIAQTLQVAGQEWLLQTACNTKLLGRLTGHYQTPFYRLGIAGQTVSPYVDLKNIFSYETLTNKLSAEMLVYSALEHGVLNQVNGNTNAISTIGVFAYANRAGIRLCLANSNNYTSIVKPQLTGYGSNLLAQFQTNMNAGQSIFLPTNGVISIGIWKGCVYAGHGQSGEDFVEYMSITGLDGGIGTVAGVPSPENTAANAEPNFGSSSQGNVTRIITQDPIDLRSGACLSEHTDLSLNGPLPLDFTRSYDTRRADTASPLGRGWSLGANIRATTHADVSSMTGGRSPEESAAAVAACTVINDLLASGETALSLGVASIVTDWLVSTYQNGAVSVYLNDRPLTFIRRADGVYSPPPGTTLTLTGTNGAFAMSQRLGGTWNFDRNNNATNYVDPDGNAVIYGYNSQTNLVAVSNSFGRGFSMSWNSTNQITSVTGSDGRVVRYGYNAAGNLTNVTDAAGMNWAFIYDPSNRLVLQIDPEGWLVSSNAYNALDQVTNQLSATGQRWTFRNAANLQAWQNDPGGRRTSWGYDSNGQPIIRFGADGSEDDWYYDGQGHVTYHDDPIGIWTLNSYDNSNNLLCTVSAAGTANAITNSFAYDGTGHLVAATNAAGRVTQFQWDAKHHLAATIPPDGTIATNIYNSNGLPTTIRVMAGGQTLRETTIGYDNRGLSTSKVSTDTGTSTMGYDGCGNLTGVTNPLGRVTQFQYDPRGLLTNTLDAAAGRTSRTYWRNGLLRAVTDAAGHSATSVWTHAGNPAATYYANGGVATNEYDNAERLVATKDPRGNRVAFDLDDMGRVTRNYTPNWQEFTWYDIEGCVTTRLNAVYGQTDIAYDWLNRPITVTDTLRRNWYTTYDPLGTVTNTVDPRNRVTSYGLDILDRRTRIAYPSGRAEGFGFDALGRQTTFTNADGHVYQMFYDAQNRFVAATNAAGEQVFRNFFDSCGNLTNKLDGANRPIQYQFDTLNRCTNTVYSDGSAEAFTFDSIGNLLTAKNAATTNTFAYDVMNHLTSSVSRVAGVSFTSTYRYDLGGLTTNVVYPGGNAVRYGYDLDGRLTNVTDWAGHAWRISRDAAGRMTALAYPNNISETVGYDASSAVTNWIYSGADTNLPGRRITRDVMGLKTKEKITSGPLPLPATNRRAANTFNAANRLTSAKMTGTNKFAETYNCDACGALTNVTRTTGVNDNYSFDLAGRMISASATNLALSANYDALGNRVQTTVNGITHLWMIDHTDPLKRPLMETDTNGTPVRFYVWGAGRLLAAIDADGTTRYAHSDDQGNIVALTDDSGAVIFTASYGPYGESWGSSGNNPTPFGWLGNHGVFHVANSSLYLTHHRAYDTTLKRFLSQDPLGLGGGPNVYAYASGNPLSYIDPLGLCGNSFSAGENSTPSSVTTYLPEYASGPVLPSLIAATPQPYVANNTDTLTSGNGTSSRSLAQAESLCVSEGAIGTRFGEYQMESQVYQFAGAMAAPAFGAAANTARSLFGTAAEATELTAYRAINPAYADATEASGQFYRSGASGRLGNDGIYANTTVEGATAEFQYHNPGVTPVVFKVNYPASPTLNINPPSGYFNSPLPFTGDANILTAPSLRAPGTMNLLIREGTVPAGRVP